VCLACVGVLEQLELRVLQRRHATWEGAQHRALLVVANIEANLKRVLFGDGGGLLALLGFLFVLVLILFVLRAFLGRRFPHG
jgi:hypothetical protein